MIYTSQELYEMLQEEKAKSAAIRRAMLKQTTMDRGGLNCTCITECKLKADGKTPIVDRLQPRIRFEKMLARQGIKYHRKYRRPYRDRYGFYTYVYPLNLNPEA